MILALDFKWYTVAEVAQKLQLSRPTVYVLIKRGELVAEKKFNRMMINEDSLKNYLTPKLKAH